MLPFSGLTLPQASGVALVADLGFAASYQSTDSVNPPCSLTITMKRDGTWTITVGAGDSLAGTPTSGTWASSPSATVGDDAQVQYVATNQVGAPNITNNASSYTTMSSDITFVISKSTTLASADVQINVLSGSNSVTDTTNTSVDGT